MLTWILAVYGSIAFWILSGLLGSIISRGWKEGTQDWWIFVLFALFWPLSVLMCLLILAYVWALKFLIGAGS